MNKKERNFWIERTCIFEIMENSKKKFLWVIFLVLNYYHVSGFTSCFNGQCSCNRTVLLCKDTTNPSFRYRPSITRLYLQNVQILDINTILRKLPNLKYITFKHMRYFKCEWLKDIPREVSLKIDICQSTTSSEIEISTFSDQPSTTFRTNDRSTISTFIQEHVTTTIYGNDISTINQAHATTSIENDRTTITRDDLSSGMQYL